MLNMPMGSPLIKIIGIDPGTDMLGVAILTINLDTLIIEDTNAFTLSGAKLSKDDYWNKEIHGNRFSRINALRIELLKIFNYNNPIFIFSESPFINYRFPAAGIALTEVLSAINRAVIEYSIWNKLHLVPPSSVKQAINAPGNATKEMMKEKILEYKNLNCDINTLDEHSIDAIAVALYAHNKLTKGELYV